MSSFSIERKLRIGIDSTFKSNNNEHLVVVYKLDGKLLEKSYIGQTKHY